MTQNEALRLALEALETLMIERGSIYDKAITAIKAALEVKDEPDAYGYAKRLAEAIWSKHYKTIAPQWEPFDELIGVLTQIDNMTAGLISPTQRKPMTNDEIVAEYDKFKADKEAKGEPVAWVYPEFWQHLENLNCGTAYRLTGIGRQPLYTTPPQRKPLTDEEIVLIVAECAASHQHTDIHFAKAIEAKLKEKNYD